MLKVSKYRIWASASNVARAAASNPEGLCRFHKGWMIITLRSPISKPGRELNSLGMHDSKDWQKLSRRAVAVSNQLSSSGAEKSPSKPH